MGSEKLLLFNNCYKRGLFLTKNQLLRIERDHINENTEVLHFVAEEEYPLFVCELSHLIDGYEYFIEEYATDLGHASQDTASTRALRLAGSHQNRRGNRRELLEKLLFRPFGVLRFQDEDPPDFMRGCAVNTVYYTIVSFERVSENVTIVRSIMSNVHNCGISTLMIVGYLYNNVEDAAYRTYYAFRAWHHYQWEQTPKNALNYINLATEVAKSVGFYDMEFMRAARKYDADKIHTLMMRDSLRAYQGNYTYEGGRRKLVDHLVKEILSGR